MSTSNMHTSIVLLVVLLVVPFISAGTLYGMTAQGRRLDVYTIDPQVGKVTANVTTLYLNNFDGTCNKLLLSYDNRTEALALSCDDQLYNVDTWWNWRISSVNPGSFWGKGTVVNIVPAWEDYQGGNCALTLFPPSSKKDASMGSITCFALGFQSSTNIAYSPYPFMKKQQPFVLSSSSNQIGIFNYVSKYDIMLWGQSTVDSSSNLVGMDGRDILMGPWSSLMGFNVSSSLNGATSYSSAIMGNTSVVIELTTGVVVIDLTTKSMSNVFSFCKGHAKMGSSAFDPINAIMYSIVSCFDGPKLVTFDIGNRAIKNVVNFNEDTLYIKGLFYTL